MDRPDIMNYKKHSPNRLNLNSLRAEKPIFDIYPVRKAGVVKPGNVYYIPVTSFPIPSRERNRLNQFLRELCGRYAELAERPLFSYLSILHSVMKQEVLRQVVINMFDWRPKQALAVMPNLPPPHTPSEEEINSVQEDFSLDKLHEMLPIMTLISRKAAVKSAYDTLFGAGGSVFYASSLDEKKFMLMTKEVFGYRIEDPIYRALDCLPFFRMNALLDATERQFKALYSVIDLYIGENIHDEGLIITSKVCLDKTMASLAHLIEGREPRRSDTG
jgi:hypothetical protein